MSTNAYPFLSKRQLLARINAEPAFAAECIAILQDRYEARVAGASSMGWMASHAAKATALAAKLASGEVTEKDRADAAKLAARYSKQLARTFRDRELAARPELGTQAAVFGVRASGPTLAALAIPPARTADVAPPAPDSGPALTPKKRGRPKGSKNRVKDEPKPRRRIRG
jgi:hypothetical protein